MLAADILKGPLGTHGIDASVPHRQSGDRIPTRHKAFLPSPSVYLFAISNPASCTPHQNKPSLSAPAGIQRHHARQTIIIYRIQELAVLCPAHDARLARECIRLRHEGQLPRHPMNLWKSSAQELRMLGRFVTISTFVKPICRTRSGTERLAPNWEPHSTGIPCRPARNTPSSCGPLPAALPAAQVC